MIKYQIPDVIFNFPPIAGEYGALRPRPEKLWPFIEENDHFSPHVQRTSSRRLFLFLEQKVLGFPTEDCRRMFGLPKYKFSGGAGVSLMVFSELKKFKFS